LRLSEAEQRLRDLYRVTYPGLDEATIVAALDSSKFGARDTDTYRAFLRAASYKALDCCGLIEFCSTASSDRWIRDSLRFRGDLDTTRYFAVGFDPATSAVFCLHRLVLSGEPVVSIVDQGVVLESAFSSFAALLRVLTVLLNTDVVLYVERGAAISAEQRRLVAALCAADPDGFGRVGWPAWFRRAMGDGSLEGEGP